MKNTLLIALVLLFSTGISAQNYPDKFMSIEGWSVYGEKQFFNRDNLYDYINGASDFYLGYDFQDLWVVDYKNSAGQLLTLELYRHGDEMQTFGIYTEERPQSASLLEIGAQGFKEGETIFFLADNYYVKVYNGRPLVDEAGFVDFSKLVAQAICTRCGLPEQFAWFPMEGKIKSSERYMSENFMGITGFNGVCTVEYKTASKPVRLFVFKGDDKKCRAVLEKYFTRLKYKKKIKERTYNLVDPYIGNVKLSYKSGVICGVLGAKDPEVLTELLAELHASVK